MKLTKYYECSICQSLNHASRLHCHSCGTTPAMYSIDGAARNCETLMPVVVASGAVRSAQHRMARFGLRTVELTTYAMEK